MEMMVATDINNRAIELERMGNYPEAEQKYLQALKMKEELDCSTPTSIALTQNGLAELYLKMGKLDQAQELLEKAYEVRKDFDDFDKSRTADHLGRIFEIRGNIKMAKEWRTKNAPDRMICSHFLCPKSCEFVFSKQNKLIPCTRCKSAFYCGMECIMADMRRHSYYCMRMMRLQSVANDAVAKCGE